MAKAQNQQPLPAPPPAPPGPTANAKKYAWPEKPVSMQPTRAEQKPDSA